MIELHIPSVPVAQPRSRMRTLHLRVGGTISQAYVPSKHPVNAFKASVRGEWCYRYGHVAPLDGPLSVELLFVFPRPKNRIWKTKPMPREPHDKKPDLDNLAKSVLDALNQIAWRDDSQIVRLTATKQTASGDEQPHVVVRIGEESQEDGGE